MAVVDLATGAGGPLVDYLSAEPEPARLYPEPFMTVGARAKMWWGQRQAGRDL